MERNENAMKATKKIVFMGRGTTPRIKFRFPYTREEVNSVCISFLGMESETLLHKNITGENLLLAIDEEAKRLKVKLTQDDTRKPFKENEKIMMSIRTVLADGSVPYCPPMYTYWGRVLLDENCNDCGEVNTNE